MNAQPKARLVLRNVTQAPIVWEKYVSYHRPLPCLSNFLSKKPASPQKMVLVQLTRCRFSVSGFGVQGLGFTAYGRLV